MHRTVFPLTWLVFACAAMVGCGPQTFVIGITPGDQRLKATVVEADPARSKNRVAIIDVTGMIMNMDRPGLLRDGENPVSTLHEKLRAAANDDRVKAVILRLNTPGGTVTASDVMYREVERFRQQTGKPVVALMMDVAASGGYYVACSADHIVAYPTTVTGSIGVLIQTISIKPMLSRWGIEAEALTSGPNKDAGSPFSVMTDEQRAVLQRLVDEFYGRFTDLVRERRPDIDPDRFAEVTDGRVVTGVDAVELGLADELGDLYTAFDRAKVMAAIDGADLILYHRPLEYVASPYATASHTPVGGTQVNLAQINLDGRLPGFDAPVGFYYLWWP